AGSAVTTTDPAGKWKTLVRDGMGQLVQVAEPNPAGGANHQTFYSYNLVGQLTQVSMPRDGYTQVRSFTYDAATGRLTQTQQPENGTMTYTYNANGTVATRTDARGVKAEYTYDAYRRLTKITYNNNANPCQAVDLYYDTNPLDGAYSANGWGRKTAERFQVGCGTAWQGTITYMYSYTSAGSVTKKRMRFNRGTQQADLEASYSYDNEGRTATVKTPDAYGPSGAPPGWVAVPGTTFTYTYDTMGRPSKLTANGADSVKDAVYGPAGELKSLWYSGVTETRTYNSRLQVTRITAVLAGYGSAGTMDIEYRYAANQNNGQVVQTKDWVTGEEVTYQYDALERLMHAETTGPEWGTTYTYDGFGNLTGKVTTKGTAPVLSVAVDPATNRMVGQSYSASGALLSVTSPGVATALYDVENRLVAPNSNDALRYDYDPQNKRVWSYAG